MQYDKINLYSHFNLNNLRQEKSAGYLRVLAPEISVGRPERKRPTALIIGGGGYSEVSDREQECIAYSFLAKGYVTFVLDYSCAPVKYPYCLLEAELAMLYIKENAEKYAVDVEHITAIGFSAGGHLTAMLGIIPDEKEISDILGDKVYLARPNALVLSYPVILSSIYTHGGSFNNLCGDDATLREKLSLEKRVDKNSPPAFIWATTEDRAVPVENSLLLASAYRKQAVPFELHLFEKGGHGLSLATDETFRENVAVQKWVELALTWLNGHGFKIRDEI